ncbi:MAG: hypothetical protein LBG52_00400 [Candidatus Peribacteria bacterium]|jgi:hypothetical protein|nr:hypothetical protein [Candidatus Peribacteria bacterium]
MEGYVSVFELQADGTRKVVNCYSYHNWSIFQYEATEEELANFTRYARGTTQFDRLEAVPLETCEGNAEILCFM